MRCARFHLLSSQPGVRSLQGVEHLIHLSSVRLKKLSILSVDLTGRPAKNRGIVAKNQKNLSFHTMSLDREVIGRLKSHIQSLKQKTSNSP